MRTLPSIRLLLISARKLASDPKLGLVGTPICGDFRRNLRLPVCEPEHVSGACQVFRRECFEAIGGYVPARGGRYRHYRCNHRQNEWLEDPHLHR